MSERGREVEKGGGGERSKKEGFIAELKGELFFYFLNKIH